MDSLEHAIAIAVEAHKGQFDKAGQPYILHPLRVMLALRGTQERIVGVLHDVCEDCPGWDFARLRREGFSDEVIAGLDAVTARHGEDYLDFVKRAARNPLGLRVKRADLEDNCDLNRITTPTERDHERISRYRCAITYLDQLKS